MEREEKGKGGMGMSSSCSFLKVGACVLNCANTGRIAPVPRR